MLQLSVEPVQQVYIKFILLLILDYSTLPLLIKGYT